jgi:hypothetical protein
VYFDKVDCRANQTWETPRSASVNDSPQPRKADSIESSGRQRPNARAVDSKPLLPYRAKQRWKRSENPKKHWLRPFAPVPEWVAILTRSRNGSPFAAEGVHRYTFSKNSTPPSGRKEFVVVAPNQPKPKAAEIGAGNRATRRPNRCPVTRSRRSDLKPIRPTPKQPRNPRRTRTAGVLRHNPC